MKLKFASLAMFLIVCATAYGQDIEYNSDGTVSTRSRNKKDTLENKNKKIPKGVRVWTVDEQFGDITRQPLDTVTHLFQNTAFTEGIYGNYNTLGNLGTPRIDRIYTDRLKDNEQFFFTAPYDYFLKRPSQLLFTNTLSPYANLTYLFSGNRTNGQDNFRAKYGVNAGKRIGFGFDIHYLYGRGYYADQSTSLLDVSLYGSYIGDHYQAHLIFSLDRIKIAENGGITDDYYITHPESFDDSFATSEIPTMLNSNWNRNKGMSVFFSHRYNLGFHRRVPMTEEEIEARKFAIESQKENEKRNRRKARGLDDDEDYDEEEDEVEYTGRPDDAKVVGDDNPTSTVMPVDTLSSNLQMDVAMADSLARVLADSVTVEEEWMKDEFVPVTSFIHTFDYESNERIYQAYYTPEDYYANTYYDSLAIHGDSIYDKTRYYRIRNTLAISLLEGFNKWVFCGLKLFATSDFRHYTMPNEYNQLVATSNHNLSIGAQMSRTQGKTFNYFVQAETWLVGDESGQLKIDASANLNFRLFGDTLSFTARGFFHNEKPNYYLRHFHSQHYWWDNDLSKSTHTRIEGILSYRKTHTTLRFAFDELTNYTYLSDSFTTDSLGRFNNAVSVHQASDAITVLTASINQHFILGPLNWETELTWQKSTKQDILPVPTINIYTNLYLRFRIAKVLLTEIGGDMRYFTSYTAPDYNPGVGQYVVQGNEEKVKVGNYPTINVYLNFNLKGTRFFVMYTHVNCGSGNSDYFLTPHYPLNRSVLRFGLSWNFFN